MEIKGEKLAWAIIQLLCLITIVFGKYPKTGNIKFDLGFAILFIIIGVVFGIKFFKNIEDTFVNNKKEQDK